MSRSDLRSLTFSHVFGSFGIFRKKVPTQVPEHCWCNRDNLGNEFGLIWGDVEPGERCWCSQLLPEIVHAVFLGNQVLLVAAVSQMRSCRSCCASATGCQFIPLSLCCDWLDFPVCSPTTGDCKWNSMCHFELSSFCGTAGLSRLLVGISECRRERKVLRTHSCFSDSVQA